MTEDEKEAIGNFIEGFHVIEKRIKYSQTKNKIMNILEKLDTWYREWAGHSHLDDSNREIFDSAEMQDFARYCIEQFESTLSDGLPELKNKIEKDRI